MSECTHDCSSCGASCPSRDKQSLIEKPHAGTNIKKVIAVMSGKGGVGKSLVSSLCAVMMNRRGYKAAILDADMTGPSIPLSFGVHERARANSLGFLPSVTPSGISMISINMFLDDETDPVVWRGSIISNTVKQFWTDVIWGDIDFMFVDMPPGTGDVPITIFQSLPLDGIIIVTSPQDLVSMIVTKAVNMAGLMGIPVLGIVENMSYFVCDKCGEKHYIYGKSNLDELAAERGIDVLARLPMRADIAAAVDRGKIDGVDVPEMSAVADRLEQLL